MAVAAVLSAACGMACGSTTEAVETPPADAAPDPPDATEVDAGTKEEDASTDVRMDAPVFTGWCASLSPTPRFCDSFDDGVLANGWDQLTVIPGSSASLETLEFRSSPASFLVDVPTLPAQTIGNVHLRTTIAGTGTRARFGVSGYFSQTTFASGAVAIATIDVTDTHWFTLWLRDMTGASGASLEETVGATITRHPLTTEPPAGGWTRIDVDLDLAAGTATVRFDGTVALDAASITQGAATNPTIRVGAVYAYGPLVPFSALFDDLVLDF